MNDDEAIAEMSSKKFGSIWAPDQLVADFGDGLTKMNDSAEYDFRHHETGTRIELKAARIRSGAFVFQYIRPECFDVCVCLGWEAGGHSYWVIPSSELTPFLSKQHRNSPVRQLRIGIRSRTALSKFAVARTELARVLSATSQGTQSGRDPVRLDSALREIYGWSDVADSIGQQLEEDGLSDWSFVIMPLREPVDEYEPRMLPYPAFYRQEQRIEFWVHPEIVGDEEDINAMAGSLFGFLIQYLYPEDMDDFDSE